MYIKQKILSSKKKYALSEAEEIKERARQEAEALYKNEVLKAKEEAYKIKRMADDDAKERRKEVSIQERRIIQKEEQLDKKEEKQDKREKELYDLSAELEKRESDLDSYEEQQKAKLYEISNLTKEQAKQIILDNLDKQLASEKAKKIKENDEEIKKTATKEAKEILTQVIQKCAADHTSETTISVVSLPSDEMKGRIIGREGRNIKSLETLTGAQFIIDDTPEAITISAFDPVRREVARLALQMLVDDGRIHPTKIEETVDKAIQEVEETITEEGERAMIETGVGQLPLEIIRLLRKIKI